jgi:uncharacterized protein YprB with RNaseH-like and TPR domain
MSLLSRLHRTLGAPSVGGVATTDRTPAPAVRPGAGIREALERLGRAQARRFQASGDGRPGDAVHGRQAQAEGALPPCFKGPALPFDDAMPSGRAIDTPEGPVWSVRSVSMRDATHGAVPLTRALLAPWPALAHAVGDARLDGFDVRRALFLDIETTGLEHGAGNVAFIVAAGWFEGDAFVLEQLVLREAAHERALLHLIWRWLDAHPFLVSFNGKSFDLTILQNRLVMHRFSSEDRAALKLRPHLDLLHTSRALFKGVFADTRLQTLERTLVGFEREDDMPGALAPACYFAWLREGHAGPFARIVEHNRDDVLSMVALAALLAETAPPGPHLEALPRVALNLATRHLRQRQPASALAVVEAVSAAALDADIALPISETAFVAARRLGRLDEAARHASQVLALDPSHAGARRMARRLGGA